MTGLLWILVANTSLAIAPEASTAPPELRVNAGKAIARVSPLFAGLMTEEIDHAYDGGLYAELISNRAFTYPSDIPVSYLRPKDWSPVVSGSGAVSISSDDTQPLNSVLKRSLRLGAIAASPSNRAGVANDGFWGIPVTPGAHYHATFFAKTGNEPINKLALSIESNSIPTVVYSHAEVHIASGGWRRYDTDLMTATNAPSTSSARFVISTERTGVVWLNLVSLFPQTWKGQSSVFRVDLMQKIADLTPQFLRFPGGDFLEGNTIQTRFEWKNAIGPISERPTHPSPGGYQASDGMGLLEYLNWCEDLHLEPILAVYAGLSLDGTFVVDGERHQFVFARKRALGDFIGPGRDLEPFVQEALDEIEYITGDAATTTWGARRAKDGHPAPFKLNYIEVGNEDFFGESDYEERFTQFYDAIKGKYPNIKVIATTKVASRAPDLVDEHYYRSAQEFILDVHHFDLYSRSGPKIFVGEWATIKGEGPTPDLEAALGDAAWMIGMERNADIVVMQSYCELLGNVNKDASTFSANLIGYDGLQSYGSPSYYAQRMFNKYRGDEILWSSPGVTPGVVAAATRDTKTNAIYLKVLNANETAQTIKVVLSGVTGIDRHGRQIMLSGNLNDTNSLKEPEKIIPVETELDRLKPTFDHTFPARSITVLELHTH